MNVDELDSGISDESPDVSIDRDDIAFIHYTSGSTGKPKGVIYSHRYVLHIVMRYTNGQQICSDDRLSLLSSYSYGASVGNIFGGLLNGAAILPFDLDEGFVRLARWLVEEGITIYYSVPAVFRRFAEALTRDQKFPMLRLIRLGGETVYRRDVELYQRHFPDSCILHIGLGTTETNLIRELLLDKTSEYTGDSRVGYAVEDMDVILLDNNHQPVGPECTGEIAVRSRYISPGYWRRQEQTDRAFLPDPDRENSRIYLTGDLGRMTPDGCLIHLGRKDSQLKIRGHRVEAAEVETALRAIDGVREVTVTTGEKNDGEKRLIAHLVFEKRKDLTSAELQAMLRESMPDFMIPSAFFVHAELPRTPGGKVDRNQLTHSPSIIERNRSSIIGPRNSFESRLAGIWERVLEVKSIGIKDDFFSLGGDSLVAAEVVAEIETAFGTALPASVLIQAPTIEQMAKLVEVHEVSNSAVVPIQSNGLNSPFFCVHGIGGEVISFRSLAEHLGPEQPFYGLRASLGPANSFSVEDIAAHYIDELQRIQVDGPYYLGGYSFGGTVAFEMAHQLTAAGKRVGLLALFDTYGPGYPRLAGLGVRTWVHLRNLIQAEGSAKREYLRERVEINGIRFRKRLRQFRYSLNGATTAKAAELSPGNLEAVHQQASRSYIPRPYPGKIHLFRAINQKEIWEPDPHLGWSGLALGGIRVHVPGDHKSLIAEPNVRQLAESLMECLIPPES